MDKNDSSNFCEALKKYFENKNSQNIFNPLVPELAEIFHLHYTLVESINKVEIKDENMKINIENMKINIEENIRIIINIIEILAHRKIILSTTIDNLSIYKVSKSYNSDLREIYELNNLKNIFPDQQKTTILIPLKTL